MAKILSDEQNSRLNDIVDELKRRVQHENIEFERAVNALNRIMHRNALTMDPVRAIWRSGLYKEFTEEQAIVVANLLDLDGFVLDLANTSAYQIRALLIFDREKYGKSYGTFIDFTSLRKGQIQHGVNVCWEMTINSVFSTKIIDNPDDQNLQKWPDDFEATMKMMARIIYGSADDSTPHYTFLTMNNKIFYL